MSRRAVLGRAAAECALVAVVGLVHAAAAGVVVVAGVSLAAPGALEIQTALEAVAQAVAFGLGCLRVPLEAGAFRGTFAPLTGLAVTLWGLGWAVRRTAPRWPGGRTAHVAAVAAAFSLGCAGAALAAAPVVEASVAGAAVGGAVWGAVGAAGALSFGSSSVDLPRLRDIATLPFGPLVGPGLLATLVAFALATAWFLVAVVVRGFGSPAGAFAGGVLLGIAVAPNAAAALVAVALGGRVEAVVDGAALADPISASVSLWDWAGGGVAPPYVLLLGVVPAIATLAGGRLAAVAAPQTHVVVRGLCLGAVFGAAVVAAGWVGALAAGAGAPGELSLRLGFEALPAFGVAVAWGVAGAYLGPRLTRRGPRLGR